jgi:hypothetical protein
LVAYILTPGLIALIVYAGYRNDTFSSVSGLLRNFLAFLMAMTFFEPLAGLLSSIISNRHPWPENFRPLSLALLYGVVMLVTMWAKTKYSPPQVPSYQIADRISGVVCGVASGIIITGFILILWSVIPFSKYLPGDFGRVETDRLMLNLDSGRIMLRFYGFTARKMGGGRPFLLEDEPVTVDFDGDKEFDQNLGEEWQDVNRNGRWDRGWLWRYRHHADFNRDDLAVVTSAAPAGGTPGR